MDSFNEDKRLEDLLESVCGRTESFRSVVFMVADCYGVREELKAFLECGTRNKRDVWLELANLCNLKLNRLKDGSVIIFPRVKTVRFCVDINRGVIGSGSQKRYYEKEACIAYLHIDEDDPEVISLLLEHLEEDARSEGYSSIFALIEDDDEFEAIYLESGYLPSDRKDDRAFENCLGCCILYDRTLTKTL